MKIDGNELCKRDLNLGKEGKKEEGEKLRLEFVNEVKASGIDHCSCPEACIHHGNCFECVIIHRGHRDHLPFCFWDMVNEKMKGLSDLTEGSLLEHNEEK